MKSDFYQVAKRIKNIAGAGPRGTSHEDLAQLYAWLREEKFQRFFYAEVEDPEWVPLLNENGFFLQVPEPVEDSNNPGFFGMPVWHAGEFLAKMATKYPSIEGIVVEVALGLETENASAIRTMLEAIRSIPSEMAARTVDSIAKWSKPPFARGMMLAHEMGLVMEYLAIGGQVKAATQVLHVLCEPIAMDDRYKEGKTVAGSNHDIYWLNEVFINNLPILLEKDLIGVIEVLETRLIEAIDLEKDPNIPKENYPAISYWRMNIRQDAGRTGPRDYKDLIVSTLIRSIESAVEQGVPEVSTILNRYLDSSYAIQKRIAVYILRLHGAGYPDVCNYAYNIWLREGGWEPGSEEMEFFLEAQYGLLSLESQRSVIRGDYQQWRGENLKEWAERGAREYPDQFRGNTFEEKVQSYLEEEEFRHLHAFAKWLAGEDAKRYGELSAKYESPGPRQESGVVIPERKKEESPIEMEELSQKSIGEVIQYLVDFVPIGDDDWGKPSRRVLAGAFQQELLKRLDEFVDSSALFIRDDLHFVYHEAFFSTLEKALKSGKRVSMVQLIDLCEYVVAAKVERYEPRPDEPGLPHAKLTVANFLEQILREKEEYEEEDVLKRVEHLLLSILNEENDPLSWNETSEEHFDAATASLNTMKGQAMHALIGYALYCERKRKADGGDKDTPVLVPGVKAALEAKLENIDTTLAEHSVLGWFFPQLLYLDKAWALENKAEIFPLEKDRAKHWLAAWGAYVRFSNVYTNVFPELVQQYQIAASLLALDKQQGFVEYDGQLSQHLLKAYLLGLIDTDSEDGLIRLYFEKASDEVRAQGNFWLSQALAAQPPESVDETWTRIWQLWKWRVETAAQATDKSNLHNEITSYCRLLPHTPVELDQLHSVLGETIQFKGEGHFDFVTLIEYLAKNAERHLSLSVDLLLELMYKKYLPYIGEGTRNNIQEIFEFVRSSSDIEAKRKVVEMINLFGERGDYSWLELLEQLG